MTFCEGYFQKIKTIFNLITYAVEQSQVWKYVYFLGHSFADNRKQSQGNKKKVILFDSFCSTEDLLRLCSCCINSINHSSYTWTEYFSPLITSHYVFPLQESSPCPSKFERRVITGEKCVSGMLKEERKKWRKKKLQPNWLHKKLGKMISGVATNCSHLLAVPYLCNHEMVVKFSPSFPSWFFFSRYKFFSLSPYQSCALLGSLIVLIN